MNSWPGNIQEIIKNITEICKTIHEEIERKCQNKLQFNLIPTVCVNVLIWGYAFLEFIESQ